MVVSGGQPRRCVMGSKCGIIDSEPDLKVGLPERRIGLIVRCWVTGLASKSLQYVIPDQARTNDRTAYPGSIFVLVHGAPQLAVGSMIRREAPTL